MTTEDDFQAALDANPADWQTRLVFADWLQERGDPRADGYRVLGQRAVHPIRIQMERAEGEAEWLFIFGNDLNDSPLARQRWGGCMLPELLFKTLNKRNRHDRNPWWHYFVTRREAEDAAARGFLRLAKAHGASC